MLFRTKFLVVALFVLTPLCALPSDGCELGEGDGLYVRIMGGFIKIPDGFAWIPPSDSLAAEFNRIPGVTVSEEMLYADINLSVYRDGGGEDHFDGSGYYEIIKNRNFIVYKKEGRVATYVFNNSEGSVRVLGLEESCVIRMAKSFIPMRVEN